MKSPAGLGPRFEDALGYAFKLHGGQTRKGVETPYIAHLLGTAALVIEDGGSEDEAIAALLHDAAEDRGGRGRLEEIRARFGEHVAGIVEACSDTLEDVKPEWRARKERYLEHLRRAPADVLRVSAADKLYNAAAILRDYRGEGEAVWGRFRAGREDELWYYRSLADIFAERMSGHLAEELRRVVAEIERLARAG